MLLKDRLESDTRVLFKVREAVELTGKSQNWFLDKAQEKEIEFLYRIPTDEVVYCLIPGRENAQFNNQFEGDDLSLNPRTTFLESRDYEYAVLSHLHYSSVLLEGESALKSFTITAALDSETKTLKYTHASSIQDKYQDKPKGYSELSFLMNSRYLRNEFRIFNNPEPSITQKRFGYYFYAKRPDATIDTTITIDDLWITRESLLTSVGEIPLDEYITDFPWANVKLKALNLACMNYYNNVFGGSEKKEHLKNFLKEKIIDITDNALKFCVEVITESQPPKNIAFPLEEEINRYPSYFPYCLVNMNEVSRQLYTEYREKIKNGANVKSITSGIAEDKAKSLSALPERRIVSLASFMKPNL